jgi:hypothetical protein
MSAMVAAALMLLTVAAAPAAAAKPGTESFSYSQSGRTADAWSGDCTENNDGTVTCSSEGIFVFEGKTRAKGGGATRINEVCYTSSTDTFDPEGTGGGSWTFASGCAPASVVWGDDLSTVTINRTTMTLEGESCTHSGDPESEPVCTATAPRQVVIEGTFTGAGSLVRESFRSFRDDGHCVQRESSSGYSRNASFDGTVNGEPVVAQDAYLRDGRFSYSATCSVE